MVWNECIKIVMHVTHVETQNFASLRASRALQFALFAILLLISTTAHAQIGIPEPPPRDTSKNTIKIENADSMEYMEVNDEAQKHLVGNVVLDQDGVKMFADSMVVVEQDVRAFGNIVIEQDSVTVYANRLKYSGQSRKTTLYDEVVLSDGKQKLFTDKLDYNLDTKIGEYHTGATLEGENTNLKSTHGYYHTETKQAYFKGNVEVVDSNFALTADTLHYDTEKQISYFHGPTNIETDDKKIYCEAGFYNSAENYAEFEQNVKFKGENQYATSDKIIYDGDKDEVYFEGKTNFQDENRIIESGDAYYDSERKISQFRNNVKIADSTQVIYADSLDYYEEREFTKAWGDVVIQSRERDIWADSLQYDEKKGTGIAWGEVVMIDSTQSIWADQIEYGNDQSNATAEGKVLIINREQEVIIDCERATYNDSTAYIHATGRPLMRTLVDADTLYLAADTLRSFKPDPQQDERTLIAVQNVRVYKSDFQAVSDSLVYSTVDSVFQFYDDPVVWSDTSQFSADTILIFQRNNEVQKINLDGNAFIINVTDDSYYNQIKGKNIYTKFDSNEVRLMDVKGNGQTIYYIRDDKNAYIGVNKTACSDMLIYFGDNTVEQIKFYKQPDANITPMRQANHSTLRLDGFNWSEKERPKSPFDVRFRQK